MPNTAQSRLRAPHHRFGGYKSWILRAGSPCLYAGICRVLCPVRFPFYKLHEQPYRPSYIHKDWQRKGRYESQMRRLPADARMKSLMFPQYFVSQPSCTLRPQALSDQLVYRMAAWAHAADAQDGVVLNRRSYYTCWDTSDCFTFAEDISFPSLTRAISTATAFLSPCLSSSVAYALPAHRILQSGSTR